MRTYPLTEADLVTPEDLAHHRTMFKYQDVMHMVNGAFFDGFILANCDTQEDFDNISVGVRLEACIVAKALLAKYQGREDTAAEDIQNILEKEGTDHA